MEKLLKQIADEMRDFRQDVNERFNRIESGQVEAIERFNRLESGQEEIKELIKHNTTLLTENLTNFRIDIRKKHTDVQTGQRLL